MDLLKEYSEKFGIESVTNSYGETVKSTKRRIIFPNGWIASIVTIKEANYSVAVCDYDGYFNWSILNTYGAKDGHFCCDTELDVLIACETIRRLPSRGSK